MKDPLPPDQAGPRLRSVLNALFQYQLLAPSEGREIESDLRAGQKLRWDVGQLELAVSLREQFRRAVATTNEAFPVSTQTRLRSALESQMRDRVIDLAASAQRFTRDSATPALDIRAEAENLDIASARLVRLAKLLDTLKSPAEGRKLIAARRNAPG